MSNFYACVNRTVYRMAICALIGTLVLVVCTAGAGRRQSGDEWDEEPIQYLKKTPKDQISELQAQIDSGKVKLEFQYGQGYLPALLKALKIPLSSQMLVFSRTSLQHVLISPTTPRAIFFNQDTYVGWVQHGRIEISTVDPQLGAVFYQIVNERAAKPRFVRQTYDCLQCHGGGMTNGIPGHIVRSLYVRRDGIPEYRAGSFLTTDQSRLEDRWGGWYVTGKHGDQRHMGNVFAKQHGDEIELELDKGANLVSLNRLVDTSPYPVRTSDLVALMVLEHQTHIHNLITKASYQTRIALNYEEALNRELKRPADFRSDSFKSRIKSACEPLLKAMLFVDEYRLSSPVSGVSGFAESYSLQGPFDAQKRSLHQLDLKTRLLKYPCSSLIYSKAFLTLPAPAKSYLYARFKEVLSSQEKGLDFQHLTMVDRKNITEILRETLPEINL